MPARDYSVLPTPFIHALSYNQLIERPGISSRRRLRFQHETDLDRSPDLQSDDLQSDLQKPEQRAEQIHETGSEPSPKRSRTESREATRRTQTSGVHRANRPRPRPKNLQLEQIFPPIAICYEVEDRSRPSVSSF